MSTLSSSASLQSSTGSRSSSEEAQTYILVLFEVANDPNVDIVGNRTLAVSANNWKSDAGGDGTNGVKYIFVNADAIAKGRIWRGAFVVGKELDLHVVKKQDRLVIMAHGSETKQTATGLSATELGSKLKEWGLTAADSIIVNACKLGLTNYPEDLLTELLGSVNTISAPLAEVQTSKDGNDVVDNDAGWKTVGSSDLWAAIPDLPDF